MLVLYLILFLLNRLKEQSIKNIQNNSFPDEVPQLIITRDNPGCIYIRNICVIIFNSGFVFCRSSFVIEGSIFLSAIMAVFIAEYIESFF